MTLWQFMLIVIPFAFLYCMALERLMLWLEAKFKIRDRTRRLVGRCILFILAPLLNAEKAEDGPKKAPRYEQYPPPPPPHRKSGPDAGGAMVEFKNGFSICYNKATIMEGLRNGEMYVLNGKLYSTR